MTTYLIGLATDRARLKNRSTDRPIRHAIATYNVRGDVGTAECREWVKVQGRTEATPDDVSCEVCRSRMTPVPEPEPEPEDERRSSMDEPPGSKEGGNGENTPSR